jgi:hypothetical protein
MRIQEEIHARPGRRDNRVIGRRYQLAAMPGALVALRIAVAQDRRRPQLAFFARADDVIE